MGPKYKYQRRASLQNCLSSTKKHSSSVPQTTTTQRLRNASHRKHSARQNEAPIKCLDNNIQHKRKSGKEPRSESTSTKKKLTLEHRRKYPVSNGEILKFLSQEETALYLEQIFNEEIPSERHNIVCKMFRSGKLDFSIHSKIFHLAQVQFLEDDQTIDSLLPAVMNRIFERVDVSRVPGMVKRDNDSFDSIADHYRHKYIFHVLVPEGIVKYLQEKNGWDKNTAEKFYLDGESTLVSGLNHFNFTKHESTTYAIPSIVIEVSAMFVATTTFRCPLIEG